ncbi:MAG: Ig-like domain-containing protein, partial [Pseudomonadota bacterium]
MKFENETGQERADTTAEQLDTEVTEIIQPLQGGRVVLPAGATLDDVSVEGRDLVITLADGSRIVIPDGAVSVPEIVVNGVAVPPETVAQLIAGSDPEPAAGPTQSSGGNFAGDEGEIQAAFDIGDLLPFTAFGFPVDEEEEIIPFSDEEPEIVIQTPNDPVGSDNAIDSVNEAGLPERGDGEAGEPAGTDEASDSESTSGTIVFNATDGLASVTINGEVVSSVDQTISTPLGVLTITSVDLDAGVIEYAYTLADNTLDVSISDVFTVVVEDADGDTSTASLTINIVDDAPIAADDAATIEGGTFGPITGNVLDNDVSGADDFAPEGAISAISAGDNTVEAGTAIQGEYGSLIVNEDGSYSYSRDPGTPGGVEDVFEYTVVDSDGSVSTATLTINIGDVPPTIDDTPEGDPDDPVNGDEGTFVFEAGLGTRDGETPGSGEIADGDAGNNSDPSETTGATIAFTSADGLGSVSIAGVTLDEGGFPQTIVDDATGVLIVTALTFDPATGAGTITYEYTLADNTSGDDTSVSFDLAV